MITSETIREREIGVAKAKSKGAQIIRDTNFIDN